MSEIDEGLSGAGPPEGGRRPAPSVRELFLAFLVIGLSGFGGVLPFARRSLVEQHKWLTPREFMEILSLSQFLPGPNVINITITVGARYHGVRGAAASFAGLMAMPLVIVLLLGMAYGRYGDLPAVEQAFYGVAAAAAGLVAAMAVKIAWPELRTFRTVAVMLMVLVGMIFLGLPLLWVFGLLLPISLLWTWLARDE